MYCFVRGIVLLEKSLFPGLLLRVPDRTVRYESVCDTMFPGPLLRVPYCTVPVRYVSFSRNTTAYRYE